jgi:hypothetical protein
VLLQQRPEQRSTHGRAQPHGDSVGPWAVEGWPRSVAPVLIDGRCTDTPATVVMASVTTIAAAVVVTTTITRGVEGDMVHQREWGRVGADTAVH